MAFSSPRRVGAKVTALTLTEPYRVASMDAVLVSVGEDEYEEESRRVSDQALEHVKSGRRRGGRAVRHHARGARPALPRHHRRRPRTKAAT